MAGGRAASGASARAGKRSARYCRAARTASAPASAGRSSGSAGGPSASWATLKPWGSIAPCPYQGTVEVHPAGTGPLGPGLEQRELLERDPQRDQLGEQAGEPGPAGPDHGVRLEHSRRPSAPRARRAAPRRSPARASRSAPAPRGRAPPRRPQHPGLGLVEHVREPRGREPRQERARPPPARAARRDALRAQHALAVGLPAVLAPGEPDHARLHEHVAAELQPELARAPRKARVEHVPPCEKRRRRVSPPDSARGSPGPKRSTSVTSQPSPPAGRPARPRRCPPPPPQPPARPRLLDDGDGVARWPRSRPR